MGSPENSYEGDFVDGEITGSGLRRWENGCSYSGDFVQGEMHGQGVWLSADGKERYEGSFSDNRRHGNGALTYRNGNIFRGMFERHRRVPGGSGTLTVASGPDAGVYEGEFNKANEFHGRGTHTAADGTVYEESGVMESDMGPVSTVLRTGG